MACGTVGPYLSQDPYDAFDSFLLCTIDDQLFQVAAIHHFRERMQLAFIHADSEELQHIGMIESFQQLDLLQHVAAISPVFVKLQNHHLKLDQKCKRVSNRKSISKLR